MGLLITLEPRAVDCRVELDGKDVSPHVQRLELIADVNDGNTVVRLTLAETSVVVVGNAGVIEFVRADGGPGPRLE